MRFLFSALALGLLLAAPLHAGDDGLTGHWKFSIFESGQQVPWWLVHMQSKDGKLAVTAEQLRGAPTVKVEDVKQVGDTFTLKLHATVDTERGPREVSFAYEGKL